jgi:hypothetical protein
MGLGTFGKREAGWSFKTPSSNEHQLMEMIKDDMLLLGSYLQEKLRESELGMEPELGDLDLLFLLN